MKTAIFLSLIACSAFAAPPLLPFQGHLTTSAGVAIDGEARVVQFKIYDAPVSGNAVWAGEVHKLSVNEGLVNTILGTKTAFPGRYAGGSKVMFSEPLYVEITVDADDSDTITAADPPLLPRQVLLPANFAHVAQSAETVEGEDMLDDDGKLKAERIAVGSISGLSLADDSVPADKIVGNSIGTDQIATGGVANGELANNSVTSGKIKDGEVKEGDIGDSQVTSGKIAPGTLEPDRLKRDFAFFWDEKNYNEPGGVSAINGVQTRTLNQDSLSISPSASISRAGDIITLQPGSYLVKASSPAYLIGRHQIHLRNRATGDILLTGSSEFANRDGGSSGSQSRSELAGVVKVVGAPMTVDIRHYTRIIHPTAPATSYGVAINTSTPGTENVFTQVYVERIE